MSFTLSNAEAGRSQPASIHSRQPNDVQLHSMSSPQYDPEVLLGSKISPNSSLSQPPPNNMDRAEAVQQDVGSAASNASSDLLSSPSVPVPGGNI